MVFTLASQMYHRISVFVPVLVGVPEYLPTSTSTSTITLEITSTSKVRVQEIQYSSTASTSTEYEYPSPGNGLAPYRRQAIIWTNADQVHWCIYAPLGGDELIKSFHAFSYIIWFTWHFSHSRASVVVADGLVPIWWWDMCKHCIGIIRADFKLRPAIERWCYFVTKSLIGWVHA